MVNPRDIIEGSLDYPSVFKNREKLSLDYVPDRLPHREDKQLKQLATIFSPVIKSPGSISIRSLIVGRMGTGKTATTKLFGREITSIASSRGVRLNFSYVNCHKHRTIYTLALEMSKELGMPVPSRGLSAGEILVSLIDYYDKKNLQALVVLDEFDYFVSISGDEGVYYIARLYENFQTKMKRFHFIFIIRDWASLGNLSRAVKDYVVQNVIVFEPYNSAQLYDIGKYRSEEAFNSSAIDDEAIKFLADFHGSDKGGSGSARILLESLEVAGELADKERVNKVTLDLVKKANSIVNPEMAQIEDSINNLEFHQLLLLLSLIRLIKRKGEDNVMIGDLEEEYVRLCSDYKQEPRKHTQIYEYVRYLKTLGIINTKLTGKGYRGRSSLIGLNISPITELENKILRMIEVRSIG